MSFLLAMEYFTYPCLVEDLNSLEAALSIQLLIFECPFALM